jgi:patatin-like phospholipase/acyl hydrolase
MLTLDGIDGGGIRGVSELVMLDEVMKKVQEKGNLAAVPKPCDYFHLLAGTSTGGLVAIMLGRLEMSTEQALAAYDAFASDIFSKKNRNRFNPTEKYRAEALEKSVRKLVKDQRKGRLMRDSRPHYAKGRAFICTMPLEDRNTTVRLRSYDVNDDKYSNCLIYQAARATTAASTFFRPMTLRDDEGNEQKFVDAALGRNNPITLLPEEAISLYGTRRRLGCVVSLGTGSRKAELIEPRKGIREKVKQIKSVLKVVKEISTDTRRDHENMDKMFKHFPGVYFRFDVDG